MADAYLHNDLLIAMMETLARDGTDMESAKKAFEATKGDFTAKFTAAVRARLAQEASLELFIEVPEHPENLRKGELDALVRPASSFLRSYPSKDELLDEVSRVRRRQERRPSWIPRVDRDGNLLPGPGSDTSEGARLERPVTVTVLAELGDVTVLLPAPDWDRPELAMDHGGVGEWEAALCTVLGVTAERGPAATVPISAQANEALIPEWDRWWSHEPARPLSAVRDPGVASELLATSTSLGGVPIIDNTIRGHEVLAVALGSAGDWRYSPRWSLEVWGPGDGVGTRVTARAATAGWADEGRSGLLVYVYGGALHGAEGLIGFPSPLHSYLLCVTRSADGRDPVDAVHREVLSCPGEGWCHLGGCPETDFLDAHVLLTPIVTAGDVAAASDGDGGWAGETYENLYGTSGVHGYAGSVLDSLEVMLAGSGWVELNRSTWEGGLEEALLRRGEHCLGASYDPVTRQLRLADGRNDLEFVLQLLADDGALVDIDDQVTVDTSEHAVEQWGTDVLTAAEDYLRGRINEMRWPTVPVQGALLGLHMHADGSLRGPESEALVEGQLRALLHTAGLLPVEN